MHTLEKKTVQERLPWEGEPNKKVWQTAAGYRGIILRSSLGSLNGYCQFPRRHPLYTVPEDVLTRLVNAHGGITFDGCIYGRGRQLGFDCNHFGDFVPFVSLFHHGLTHGEYRTMEYVSGQVEELAAQLRVYEGILSAPGLRGKKRYSFLLQRLEQLGTFTSALLAWYWGKLERCNTRGRAASTAVS